MVILNSIREKLSDALKHSGMSQTELANKLDISQSNISHYIKGDKLPALDTLANICIILSLDANEILCIK